MKGTRVSATPANRTRGFSLIEILLVIGVVAVLALSAFIIYPSLQHSSRAKAEQENMSVMTAGINRLMGSSRGYSSISPQFLNEARIAPSPMNGGNYSGTSLTSSWGGYVGAGPIYDGYFFFYDAMPTGVCLKLLPMMAPRVAGLIVADTWVQGRGASSTPAVAGPARLVAACTDPGQPMVQV